MQKMRDIKEYYEVITKIWAYFRQFYTEYDADKALEAVKEAVASPLLDTTIQGASHVIINISGDITLVDASDAAEYVQDLAGEEANIIFGAMYDDTKPDEATITVIATGLRTPEEAKNTPLKRRLENTRRVPRTEEVVVPEQPAAEAEEAPVSPKLDKSDTITSHVQEQQIKIPDFFKKS